MNQDRADKKMWAFLGPYIALCVAITLFCLVAFIGGQS